MVRSRRAITRRPPSPIASARTTSPRLTQTCLGRQSPANQRNNCDQSRAADIVWRGSTTARIRESARPHPPRTPAMGTEDPLPTRHACVHAGWVIAVKLAVAVEALGEAAVRTLPLERGVASAILLYPTQTER